MMDLIEKLRLLAADTHRRREAATNEENTRSFLVEPFIKVLGYDASEPDDVEQQYASKSGPVDLALKKDGARVALIEIKRSSENLSKHELQLKRYYYNVGKGVRFGILTNGIEYRFYADLEDRHLMDDEPFMILNMQKLDVDVVKALASFTKSAFDLEVALASARTLRDKIRIRHALREEVEPLSTDLLRHFVRKVCPGTLPPPKSALRKELEGLVKQAWDEYIIEKTGKTIIVDPDPPPPPPPSTDIPVIGKYEGRRFEAFMLRSSLANGFNGASHCIRYMGRLTNGKEAMIAAIRSVDPNFNPGENQYGLGFWHVVDPADGTKHPLYIMSKHVIPRDEDEALRQRVLRKS